MTYLLNKSEKAIQKAAMEFAKGEFDRDTARECDKRAEFPEAIWRKAADLGFLGIHLPEKFSGGGMGRLENVLVAETFARNDSTTGAAVMLAAVAAEWLSRFGNEAQKNTLLPGLLEGRMRSGAAFAQPALSHQNDHVCLDTVEPGITWRINGKLDGVINANNADIFFILCANVGNTGQSNGVSMLVVEAGKPGISIEQKHDMLGLRMTGTVQLKFEAVDILSSNMIGKQDQGLQQARRILPEFRLLLAALALGTAQGSFDRALTHIKEREQFGRKIGHFQVTRHKMADMAFQIEQARCLTYQSASLADLKRADQKMITMANLAATQAAEKVSFEAIQLLGGYGYTTEYDVERCYRDAKTLQMISGYKNDLIDEIAAAVIGKLKK